MLADSIAKETLLAIKWRGKRLAVFDPVVQPDNPEFSFIYFVHGHHLTVQKKLSEAGGTSEVENIQERELCLEQYRLWFAHNEDIVERMVHREHLEVETPPPPRRKCSTCEGVGSWFDSPVKPSYGVHSEGPNIVEWCQECAGKGFVDDLLLLDVDDHLTNGHVLHEPAQKSVGESCILSKQQSAKLPPEGSRPKGKPRSPDIQLAWSAGESLPASHPEGPYWITASVWSEEMLSEAARHIVDLVVHGRQICNCRVSDHCQFLFALSLYSLADVRGNNYWPVAFEEVARRGTPVDPRFRQIRFERFFREAISSKYGSVLGDLGQQAIRHKYIALIFDQAGIGKNRGRLLKDFLRSLMRGQPIADLSGAGKVVEKALRDFSTHHNETERADITCLSKVLVRAGREFMVLAHTLERDPACEDVASWSWGDLREFWIRRTGVDINSLTPSAEEVLGELVAGLSVIWLRKEVFRLAHSGTIEVKLSGKFKIENCRGHQDIPVGPADIVFKGKTRPVVISDRRDLTPQILSSFPKDVWHVLDDDYSFKLSDSPFGVRGSRSGGQRAMPWFLGRTVQDASIAGYFWGGKVRLEGDSKVVAAGLHHTSTTNMYHGFRWRNGKLFLDIYGFRVLQPDSVSAELRLGPVPIWKGSLIAYKTQGFRRRWVDVSRIGISSDSRVTLHFEAESGSCTDHDFSLWPLSDGAFLVAGRRVYRSGASILQWGSGNRLLEVLLYTDQQDSWPVLNELDVLAESEAEIEGRLFYCWRLGLPGLGKASIRLNDKWWSIEVQRPVNFSYTANMDITLGAVSISGVGNVRVVAVQSEVKLLVPPESVITDTGVGVWIGNYENDSFCRIEESDICKGMEGLIVDLNSVIERRGAALEPGVNSLQIGTLQSRSTTTFNFFWVPGTPLIEINSLGTRSAVHIDSERIAPEILSQDPVTELVIEEGKCLRGRCSGTDWEVWLQWKPRVLDLTIDGKLGALSEYMFHPARHIIESDERRLPCRIFLPDDENAAVRVCLGDSDIALDIGTSSFDLLPMLTSKSSKPFGKVATLSVASRSNRVEWAIDLGPAVAAPECTILNGTSGYVEVSVGISGIAFSVETLTVECSSGGMVVDSREFFFSPEVGTKSHANVVFAIPRSRIDDDGVEIFVYHGSAVVARSILLQPPDILAQDRSSLVELVAHFKKTLSPNMLLAFLETSVRLVAAERNAIGAVRNISSKIVGVVDPSDEQWFRVGLRSLEYLANETYRPVALPEVLSGLPEISVLSIGLWLMIAEKAAKRGVLKPTDLDNAMIVMRSGRLRMGPEPGWLSDLSRLAYAFGGEIPGRHGFSAAFHSDGEPQTDLPLKSDAAGSMAVLSEEFENWLRKK